MLLQSISRNSVMLGIFALITTAVIAGTFINTQDKIAENKRATEQRALLEIFPAHTHDNKLLDDFKLVDAPLLGLREAKKLFFVRHNETVVGVIVPATAREGYTGDIDLIIGVNRDGSIAGVRILAHRETPGLGDKVETAKSDWVFSFNGKSLDNPKPEQWKVKKDKGVFDQFTGATITPRAVTKSIYQALEYVEQERKTLFPVQATAELTP